MNKPERLKLEAQALRYVLTLPADEKPLAAAKQNEAALELVGLWRAMTHAIQATPGLVLADVAAVLKRLELKTEAAALDTCPEALAVLDPSKGQDPETLKAAAALMLEDTEHKADLRRINEALTLLEQAKENKTAGGRRGLFSDVAEIVERAERANETTLADAWAEYVGRMAQDKAGANEVLKLDERRGEMARWFNDRLGIRGGLEAGKLFILGGGPAAGKTSLAALLAVDAMAASCPVMFWQLELSREETLEHLTAQDPNNAPGCAHWKTSYWTRRPRTLPKAWQDLLTVPQWPAPDAETIERELLAHARKAEKARRKDKGRHEVNGLFVIDYAQLMTMADAGPRQAGHEILTTAASRIAKAAGESGACVLLLSQLNKADQKEGTPAGTALAGADLARMADRVAMLHKATLEGKPCPSGTPPDEAPGKGEARLIVWTKARGVRYTDRTRPPDSRLVWYNGESRAIHSGDEPRKPAQGGLDF